MYQNLNDSIFNSKLQTVKQLETFGKEAKDESAGTRVMSFLPKDTSRKMIVSPSSRSLTSSNP